MRYRYCPNSADWYATNLRQDRGTGNLTWDNNRGQDVLIVQTPFEYNAENLMEELCQLMEEAVLQTDSYTEVKTGVWVRFVTAADKARMNNGCPINTEASTYSVFACCTEGNVCSIYAPQKNQAMISAYYSIPMQIHVDIQEQIRTEGFIKKKVVKTGYYTLSFPQDIAAGYHNGDLVCRVAGLDIPLTQQMLERGSVYIKTEHRPQVISTNKGLELI